MHQFAITKILVNMVGQRDKAWFMPRSFAEDQSSNKVMQHILAFGIHTVNDTPQGLPLLWPRFQVVSAEQISKILQQLAQ